MVWTAAAAVAMASNAGLVREGGAIDNRLLVTSFMFLLV